MKPIKKDELYNHLSGFLKKKGVELKEGPYTKGIHAGCSLLADAINLSQAGIQRARDEVAKQIDEVRQVIHEKTAPKPPRPGSNAKPFGPESGKGNGSTKTSKGKNSGAPVKTGRKNPKRRSKG